MYACRYVLRTHTHTCACSMLSPAQRECWRKFSASKSCSDSLSMASHRGSIALPGQASGLLNCTLASAAPPTRAEAV